MSASEPLGSHKVTTYDDLSVSLLWGSGFEAPIVRGMPYATVFFSGLTPVLKFGGDILSFDGSGTRYEVLLNNGQRWIVYSSNETR